MERQGSETLTLKERRDTVRQVGTSAGGESWRAEASSLKTVHAGADEGVAVGGSLEPARHGV